MKRDERTRYLIRHRILKLLSSEEVAAESAVKVVDGDEYLNLEAVDLGVRRTLGTDATAGRLLPRKAVLAETWRKILGVLADSNVAAPKAVQQKRRARP